MIIIMTAGDGSPVVARVRCIFALLSRENAPL